MKIINNLSNLSELDERLFKYSYAGSYCNYPFILDKLLKYYDIDKMIDWLFKFKLSQEQLDAIYTLLLVNFNRQDKINFIMKYSDYENNLIIEINKHINTSLRRKELVKIIEVTLEGIIKIFKCPIDYTNAEQHYDEYNFLTVYEDILNEILRQILLEKNVNNHKT